MIIVPLESNRSCALLCAFYHYDYQFSYCIVIFVIIQNVILWLTEKVWTYLIFEYLVHRHLYDYFEYSVCFCDNTCLQKDERLLGLYSWNYINININIPKQTNEKKNTQNYLEKNAPWSLRFDFPIEFSWQPSESVPLLLECIPVVVYYAIGVDTFHHKLRLRSFSIAFEFCRLCDVIYLCTFVLLSVCVMCVFLNTV